MLFALALIPVIALLVVIYIKDKKEKEPVGFLAALFFAGMGTAIPAVIAETIGGFILDIAFPYESVIKSYILAICLVAPVEELGKYVVLRLVTWKSKHFDYSYDAIVYSVFASLGFAAIENVGYVFGSGFSTAIVRMFTAVPGHACFAVFMGYFYSKSKYADVMGNKQDHIKYTLLSLIAPIVLHGIYDAIAMGAGATEAILFAGLSILVWIVFVLMMFGASVAVVFLAAAKDFCIVTMPEGVQTCYLPSIAGSWICSCGTTGYLNFCPNCGKMRPVVDVWTCPRCGAASTFNFCGNCGFKRMS